MTPQIDGVELPETRPVYADDADGFTAFSILHDILDKTLTTTEGITHKQRREILSAMDNIVMHDEQLRSLLMNQICYGRKRE